MKIYNSLFLLFLLLTSGCSTKDNSGFNKYNEPEPDVEHRVIDISRYTLDAKTHMQVTFDEMEKTNNSYGEGKTTRADRFKRVVSEFKKDNQ